MVFILRTADSSQYFRLFICQFFLVYFPFEHLALENLYVISTATTRGKTSTEESKKKIFTWFMFQELENNDVFRINYYYYKKIINPIWIFELFLIIIITCAMYVFYKCFYIHYLVSPNKWLEEQILLCYSNNNYT